MFVFSQISIMCLTLVIITIIFVAIKWINFALDLLKSVHVLNFLDLRNINKIGDEDSGSKSGKKVLKKLGTFNSERYSQMGFPGGSDCKESTCNEGDLGLIPGLGRSPRKGEGYPLQNSGLENSMDRGAWQATVHEFAKSQTQLSDFIAQKNMRYLF